jgi:hypothetical protein
MVLATPIGGALFPVGYAVPDADYWVEHFMQSLTVPVLLDIRLRACSRWYPHWNKSALQAKWGSRYVHEKRLGNVNYQYADRPIDLLDPEAALPWIIEQLQQNEMFLLVCACRDYGRCHRKTVTEYILRRCQDTLRTEGMRFDRQRWAYLGMLPVGDVRVVVLPGFFEAHRSVFDLVSLYDPEVWASSVDFAPECVMLESVS